MTNKNIPTGITGSIGPHGITGATGYKGYNGFTGPTGVTGISNDEKLSDNNGNQISFTYKYDEELHKGKYILNIVGDYRVISALILKKSLERLKELGSFSSDSNSKTYWGLFEIIFNKNDTSITCAYEYIRNDFQFILLQKEFSKLHNIKAFW